MIAALALAAQLKGTFDLSGAVGTQVRQVDPAPVITVPRLEKIVVADDLFAVVNGRLTLTEPRWSASLSAAPGFAIQDAELGKYATTEVPWEDFTAGATTNAVLWRDRHLTVTFLQALSYSRLLLTQASLYPYQQGTVGGQPPQLTNVPVSTTTAGQLGGWDPSLGASVRTSRLTTVFASAGFTFRGGLDDRTQALIPGQYGPRAAVGASEALSPLDTISMSASGQNLWTQGACPPPKPATQLCNEQVPIAQLTGNWRHTLSRASSISFMGGVAASVEQIATSNDVVVLPVAGVTYAHRFGVQSPQPNETPSDTQNDAATDTQAEARTQTQTEKTETETGTQPEPPQESPQEETLPEGSRLDDLFGTSTLTATAQLAPTVDPLTGSLSTRVSTTATLAKQLSREVAVAANLAFAQSVPVPHPDPFPLTLVGGGGTARVFLTRQVDLSLTALEQWQFQSVYGSIRSTVGSVTLTVREPTFRFW